TGDVGCYSLQSGKAVSGIQAGAATTDDPAKERGRTVGSHAAIERVGARPHRRGSLRSDCRRSVYRRAP
ncbi:MAG: hypothetical protein OXP69_14925, partial [Spirochaetaceae bacterium]|nr:hypothetical protein [Spirochaetaceae bacterium]